MQGTRPFEKITEFQIRSARYANPLTLLPGNVPIHEGLDQLISEEKLFSIAYCDVDNFKPYNDVCGYGEGENHQTHCRHTAPRS